MPQGSTGCSFDEDNDDDDDDDDEELQLIPDKFLV